MLNDKAIVGRVCGDCRVCCQLLNMEDEHRGFECLWLKGIIGKDEADRPDNLGVMFTIVYNQLTLWEHDNNKLNNDRLKYWLKKLMRKYVIRFMRLNGHQFEVNSGNNH